MRMGVLVVRVATGGSVAVEEGLVEAVEAAAEEEVVVEGVGVAVLMVMGMEGPSTRESRCTSNLY